MRRIKGVVAARRFRRDERGARPAGAAGRRQLGADPPRRDRGASASRPSGSTPSTTAPTPSGSGRRPRRSGPRRGRCWAGPSRTTGRRSRSSAPWATRARGSTPSTTPGGGSPRDPGWDARLVVLGAGATLPAWRARAAGGGPGRVDPVPRLPRRRPPRARRVRPARQPDPVRGVRPERAGGALLRPAGDRQRRGGRGRALPRVAPRRCSCPTRTTPPTWPPGSPPGGPTPGRGPRGRRRPRPRAAGPGLGPLRRRDRRPGRELDLGGGRPAGRAGRPRFRACEDAGPPSR